MLATRCSTAEFNDLLQLLLLLEAAAAQRGAHRLDTARIGGLAARERRMADGLVARDAQAYLDASEAIHRWLHQADASPTPPQLIETVGLKVGPLSNGLFDAQGASAVLNDAHGDVMSALQSEIAPGCTAPSNAPCS